MLDANTIAESLFASVTAYLEREIAPLRAKIATLETELAARPPAVIHQSLLERTVAEAVQKLPRGEKGDRGDAGERGADGIDGLDGDPGKDGANGKDGERGLPGERGLDGKDGAPGRDGRDGIQGLPGKDGLNGRDGKDGAAGLNGKDGAPGLDGKDGAAGLNGKDGLNGQDGLPGRDGINGKDGHAGMEYKGVFKYGASYERGDCVTWDNSMWHCNAPTKDRPGDGNEAWQLAVRKGKDGKDGNPPPRSSTPFGDK